MRSLRFWLMAVLWVLFVKIAAWAAPVTAEPKPVQSAAEKTRKILDQVVNVEFAEQPLHAALDQLSAQTKLKFVLDRVAMAQLGLGDPDMPVSAKLQDTKLRAGLRTLLSQYGLGYVVIDETILVTTPEMADYRQLQQRIDVDFQELPLQQALAQLARRSGANLVLDQRVATTAKNTPLTLNLNDAPLETVVRIMAAEAGLSSVRMGNVLLLTTEEKAAKLRAEPESRPPGQPAAGADIPLPNIALPGGIIGAAPPKFIPAPPAPAPVPVAPPEKDKDAPKKP